VSPQRIQRQRTKGWRMPSGVVYVGRPGIYGNPFAIPQHTADQAVSNFRAWLEDDDVPEFAWKAEHDAMRASLAAGVLRGRDLACWCPLSSPCHADVLLELANGGAS
jgi:hypothetical protein